MSCPAHSAAPVRTRKNTIAGKSVTPISGRTPMKLRAPWLASCSYSVTSPSTCEFRHGDAVSACRTPYRDNSVLRNALRLIDYYDERITRIVALEGTADRFIQQGNDIRVVIGGRGLIAGSTPAEPVDLLLPGRCDSYSKRLAVASEQPVIKRLPSMS